MSPPVGGLAGTGPAPGDLSPSLMRMDLQAKIEQFQFVRLHHVGQDLPAEALQPVPVDGHESPQRGLLAGVERELRCIGSSNLRSTSFLQNAFRPRGRGDVLLRKLSTAST